MLESSVSSVTSVVKVFWPPTNTTLMPDTMLAVVKPEAKPGAEIREVKVPVSGAQRRAGQSKRRLYLRHRHHGAEARTFGPACRLLDAEPPSNLRPIAARLGHLLSARSEAQS